MIIRRCRLNSVADYRADFDYRSLYELRRRSPEGFVQMFGILEEDPLESDKTIKNTIKSIRACAGEFAQIDSPYYKEDINLIAEGRALEVFRDGSMEKDVMKAVIENREGQLCSSMSLRAAQDVWLFAAFHRLANVPAKTEGWDYLMEMQAGIEWTADSEYDLMGKGKENIIELPYCSEAKQEEALEMVRLTNGSYIFKTVRLAGTGIGWKLFKGYTLFALRRGEMGYTGFLGCVKAGEAETFERTFGCVTFSEKGIDFGMLDEHSRCNYCMPCPATDGSTVFIGEDGRLYRMEEDGRCRMIGNPDNITIVQACSIAPGEYIVMDEKGCVRRLDEKGRDLDSSGTETIKAGAFAMAVHGGMCCVLTRQEENGVQLNLFGGDEIQDRKKMREWFSNHAKKAGEPCCLQTGNGKDGPQMIVDFMNERGIRYE